MPTIPGRMMTLGLLLAMFFLNDIMLIRLEAPWIFVFDWVFRLALIGILFSNSYYRDVLIDAAKKLGNIHVWILAVVAIGFILLVSHISHLAILNTGLASVGKMFEWPSYDDEGVIRLIDLSIGLLLVSLSEEIVFRVVLVREIEDHTKNQFIILGLSALLFGLVHWSGGVVDMFTTMIAGLVFVCLFRWSRSLWPITTAHFVVNLVVFW
jgi:membrane protease YdiL (CAAX protease family)